MLISLLVEIGGKKVVGLSTYVLNCQPKSPFTPYLMITAS